MDYSICSRTMRKAMCVIMPLILLLALCPCAAYATQGLEASLASAITPTTMNVQKTSTYWYHLTPSKQKLKAGKASLKVTGKIDRSTSIKKLAAKNGKTLGKKSRTFKVAKNVVSYGSAWIASNKRTIARAQAISNISNTFKMKYGSYYVKVRNGAIVEIRLSNA